MWIVLNQYISQGVLLIVHVGDDLLRPMMLAVFAFAIFLRLLIYFTVKWEGAFAAEFEKRVHKRLSDPDYEPNITSFHELVRKILHRTHEEFYNLKRKYRRRRFDQVTALAERLFLIVEGANRLINDTLSQTKYLRKDGQAPRFVEISKFVFESNPVFNRVLGVFPLGMCNDLLNILPGLFVVCGIFGTFLGVMGALPSLSNINVGDPAATKATMDAFLLKMAFSMGNSIIGICFSVIVQVMNAMLNPEGIYYSMVNKFTASLEFLWNDTSDNLVKKTGVTAVDRRVVAFANQKKVPPTGGSADSGKKVA